MMGTRPKSFWRDLPYFLAFTGVLVILLSGFSFFIPRDPAAGMVASESGRLRSSTDSQIDALSSTL